MRQPPRLRAFLLRTSLVDRVCGSLADALTGEGHGADTLAALERTNGFVLAVDGRAASGSATTACSGGCCAPGPSASWRASCRSCTRAPLAGTPSGGAAAEALRHAVAAEEWDLALAVVAEHWFELYVRGDAAAIRALVGELPAERVQADAEVSAALACAALDVGDTADAERATARTPRRRRRAWRRSGAARYLETMALARLAAARLEGDFAGRARPRPTSCWPRRRPTPGRRTPAREAVVHACSATPRSGGTSLERARQELSRAVTLARRRRPRLRGGVRAQRSGAGRVDGRRPGLGSGARRPRRSSSPSGGAGAASRRPRARTPRWPWGRSTTCGRATRRRTSPAPRTAAAPGAPAQPRLHARPPRRPHGRRAGRAARRPCACWTSSTPSTGRRPARRTSAPPLRGAAGERC